MVEHVISHRKPRRKRGGVWSFMLRRFGALAVTIAALATANWLAPYIDRRAPPPLPGKVAVQGTAPVLPPPSAEVLLITGEAATQAPRPRRARRGVPLDANPGNAGEDFEVLSAGELEAISQARN